MTYLVIKWLHIISSTFLFGTGVGSAFYLLCACWNRDPRVVAAVCRFVVRADWIFTSTTAVIQPLTGLYLMRMARFPLESSWMTWSIALYVVAIACWLPVVWLQMQMRNLSAQAAALNQPLPQQFWRYFRCWFALGVPAFFAFIAIFYLMVAKPS